MNRTAAVRKVLMRMAAAVLPVVLLAGPHTLRGQDLPAQIQQHTAKAERALRANDMAACGTGVSVATRTEP